MPMSESVHPVPYSRSQISSLPQKRTVSDKITNYVQKKLPASRKKVLDDNLLSLFVLDFQPFSIVEDRGFRRLVKGLNPSYEMPSRKHVSKTLIPAKYETCLIKTKEVAENISSCCLTTDNWTSRNNESFMAITIHFINEDFQPTSILLDCAEFKTRHTSKELARELNRVITEWNIKKKILIVVSDNASNIKCAITEELKLKHFGCFAHTINLIVHDALVNVETLLRNVKSIVSHFKRSTAANQSLRTYQENSGATPRKVIQDVPTRWNSTFYMIKRFVELEVALRATIALLDVDLPIVSGADWEILKQLCKILAPFETTTKVVSGESYMNGSLIIVLTNGLLDACERMKERQDLHEDVKQVVTRLKYGITTRLGKVEHSLTYARCTFLDPRFKTTVFQDSTAADKAKSSVINSLNQMISAAASVDRPMQSTIQEPINDNEDDEFSVWRSYRKNAAAFRSKGTTTSRAIIEVQRYLQDELIGEKEDPFKWWDNHKHNYPLLSQLVRENCCALATSVPCERVFSKAGNILTERRSQLSSSKLKQLLFLNMNEKFLKD